MAQSLARLWTHLLFYKGSVSLPIGQVDSANMHAYLATVLRNHDCKTLIVGGVADHVHALFSLSRNYSVAAIVKEIKRTSSSWVKDLSPQLRKFHRQNGYGAFQLVNRI